MLLNLRSGVCAGLGAGLLALAAVPLGAQAETTASFGVSAQVVSGCEINGALPTNGQSIGTVGTLDFGSHPALETGLVTASLLPATGLAVRCTPGVSLLMSTDGGTHNNGLRNLQLNAGTVRQPYRLYRDAARSQEWLAGQAVAISFTAGADISLPIYAGLVLSGTLPPGTYTDTVVITLNW